MRAIPTGAIRAHWEDDDEQNERQAATGHEDSLTTDCTVSATESDLRKTTDTVLKW